MISNPQNNSVYISSTVVLSNLGHSSAQIAGMELSIYYENGLLGVVELPELSITGGQDLTMELDTEFDIQDMEAFDKFGQDLILSSGVSWHLHGITTVNTMGLKFKNIKFSKDTLIPGFFFLKNNSESYISILS